jgi:hypothetical protein
MSDEFEDRMARWHKNYSEKLALWTPGNFAELARLHAENERLRAALSVICGPRDTDKSYVELFHEVVLEARAALKGDSDE